MKQSTWKRDGEREEEINTGLRDSLLKHLVSGILLDHGWVLPSPVPAHAYDINMKIEKHGAYETYAKYTAWHPEDAKIAEIAQG